MRNSAGNVLFLILIAVALFAALSYAVSSSNRSGTGNASSETAEMGAARLLSFMAKLDAAVMRIRLNKGVDVHQIIYSTPVYTLTDGSVKVSTPSQASNPELALFNASVSGVVPETFFDLRDKNATASGTAPGHLALFWISFPNLGTTDAEAVASIISISPEVCLKINEKSGISSIPVLTSSFSAIALPNSSGNPGTVSIPLSASNLALISGKYDFCVRLASPDNRYLFFHVYKVF